MAPDGIFFFQGVYFPFKGNIGSYFKALLKAILGVFRGSLGKAFEGLLVGVLGYIKAKALVMLANSGA